MAIPTHDVSFIFVELGAAIVGLAILARLANRWGFSAIPLYLIAGLAFGNGGLAPLHFSSEFIRVGGEIGVPLLLFMLGMEYSGDELKTSLRRGLTAGLLDFVLNFTPGLAAGFLLGWSALASMLLGGVTYISSSGVVAKVLSEVGRLNNPETQLVLSVLVLEDLAMAVYLPLVGVLLLGGGPGKIAIAILIAIVTVAMVLIVAVRYGHSLSRFVAHESDEIILLTTFGTVLLVAVLRSACTFRQQSARFWSESPYPVRLPSSRDDFSPRSATCSLPRSFSSSACRLRQVHCSLLCVWLPDWRQSQLRPRSWPDIWRDAALALRAKRLCEQE